MDSRLYKLLSKYDVAGPRYTSYPTAPAWTTEVGPKDFQNSLKSISFKKGESASGGSPLQSLYVHLPFCENLCHFCGCMTVITKDHSRSRSYVDILLKEIEQLVQHLPSEGREVVQLHFGGGTPNFLQPGELKEIVDSLRSHFHFLPEAEIAIEMHPRTSTAAFCDMLAELRFNRISLGVQDFDTHVQKLINRHQTFEMTAEMIQLLRKLGFDSFNFDLIYGLPGQTMETWEKTLEQVIDLHPNRLAVYSYAHVPWLKPYQRSFEDKDLPLPDLKLRLFEKAYERLTEQGYRSIGMDHFALEEDELTKALDEGTIHRNFMGYSTKGDAHQIGFGVSAISYVNGNYFQNQKTLEDYEAVIKNRQLATFRGFLLQSDDHIRHDLIRRIMCSGRVDIPSFEKHWRISFKDYFSEELSHLDTFINDRLLSLAPREMRVVGDGFLFLRNIAMIFDRYLEDVRLKASNPVFSRTV